MFIKVNVNEDVEFVLRKISKKSNKDMAVVASNFLKEYVSDMDLKQFETNSKKEETKQPGPGGDLDMISISELKKRVEYWEQKFGPNAILNNPTPYNIQWNIKNASSG